MAHGSAVADTPPVRLLPLAASSPTCPSSACVRTTATRSWPARVSGTLHGGRGQRRRCSEGTKRRRAVDCFAELSCRTRRAKWSPSGRASTGASLSVLCVLSSPACVSVIFSVASRALLQDRPALCRLVLRKRCYKNIRPWVLAVSAARKQLRLVGFVPLGGKSPQGKALLEKAKDMCCVPRGFSFVCFRCLLVLLTRLSTP